MKLVSLLFGLVSFPLFAAQLKGVVQSKDESLINNAKIIVYSEMVSIFFQKVNSDRNGKYQLNLDPGYYRLVVLKKGFRPISEPLFLQHDNQIIELRHTLQQVNQDQENPSVSNLKRILRRSNREPFKQVVPGPADFRPVIMPEPIPQDESLAGSLRTGTRQNLDGTVEQTADLALSTQINPAIAIDSKLSNEDKQFGNDQVRMLEVDTGIRFNLRERLALEVRAARISNQENEQQDQTRALSLLVEYGEYTLSQTSANFRQSETDLTHQEETQISHQMNHKLGGGDWHHDLNYRQWNNERQNLARQSQVQSAWDPARGKVLINAAYTNLQVEHQDHSATHFNLAAQGQAVNDRIHYRMKSGFVTLMKYRVFSHDHQIGLRLGPTQWQGLYQRNLDFKPTSHADIFGDFGDKPFTPHFNEAFFARDTQLAGVDFSFWVAGVENRFTWNHRQEELQMIGDDYASNRLARQASYHAHALGYTLRSQRWGSALSIEITEASSQAGQIDHRQVTYSQALLPFGSDGIRISFDLSMSNIPLMPGWWMLEQNPLRDSIDQKAWYQGHLTLLF